MGRLKAFDVDDALKASMNLFRARGYEATSMKDLEETTGLKPGSLYNSFGSKEELFLAALDHYNTTVVGRRIAEHLKGIDAPFDELRAMFVSLLHEPGGTKFGCLLTNTAVEFATGSKEVSARVRQGFALLEAAFACQCVRAQNLGRISRTASPKRLGLRLLHAYQGILVLVRFGRSRAELTELIDDLLQDIFEGGTDDTR